MAAGLLTDIQAAQTKQAQAAAQLASGRRFTHPSGHPAAAGSAEVLNAAQAAQVRYQGAGRAATAWSQATGTALQQAVDLLQQVRQDALSGASSTLTAAERTATAGVVGQLGQQLLQVANSRFEGLYLFAGQKVSTAPFASQTASYAGDTGKVSFEVAPGMVVTPSVAGTVLAPVLHAVAQVQADLLHPRYQTASKASATAALGKSGSFSINGKTVTVSAGESLTGLASGINAAGAGVSASVVTTSGGYALSVRSDSTSGVSTTDSSGILSGLGWQGALNGSDLHALDTALRSVAATQGQVGAVQQGLALQKQTLQGQAQTLQQQQASLEDTNVAKESVAYSEAAQGLQASLLVTSKALPQSLFTFL